MNMHIRPVACPICRKPVEIRKKRVPTEKGAAPKFLQCAMQRCGTSQPEFRANWPFQKKYSPQ